MTAFCEETVKELAARLLRKVVKRTPVGQKPILLDKNGSKSVKNAVVKGKNGKNKSFLTREGEILERYWSGYVGGSLRRGWQVSNVQKIGDEYAITVFNQLEYASYVEYGHRQTPGRYVPALGRKLLVSWVPGKFMLTISERELQASSMTILEQRLTRLLEENLNG